jgi:ribonuclease HI
MKIHYCYVDGACSNNGKVDAVAEGSYAIYVAEGDMTHEMLSKMTPTKFEHRTRFALNNVRPTNNVAEAMAVLSLLTELKRLKAFDEGARVVIYCDSELTVNQLAGLYKIKNKTLKDIHAKIKTLLADQYTTNIRLEWISGDFMKQTILNH